VAKSSQLGLVDGKRFEDWPAWDGKGVPTRDNCDLTNPRQKFLWMYTALPGVKGAPLVFPVEYWEQVSWRQCVLGADLVGEPGLQWQAPLHVAANPWLAAGQWVYPGTPEPERSSIRDVVSSLPAVDRAEIETYVKEKIGLTDAPDVPPGQYRVSDVAKRLDVPVDEITGVLGRFGLTVTPTSLIGRDIADRIVAHLEL